MFILHLALQGCLRARNVEYGLTADTGGHIRYLLDLIEASARDPRVERIVIATRRFESRFGPHYTESFERISEKAEIVRLGSLDPSYLEKEALHTQVRSYAEALVDWIEAQPSPPQIIHAHYADAASVAAIVEDRLGIPFVFTAHSLGRVKRTALGTLGPAGSDLLDRRIASEENALARASLVIASSRDEAEVQWAGYDRYEPGRIRILPPGSDLTQFQGAASDSNVDAWIGRFLRDPEKPVLLALARPVRKKNLCALVQAFGESPALQKRANLVIIAGSRDDYADLDGDMAEEIEEILHLVDRYDLYGKIAYPKHHRPEDVPAIYAHARERGGLFVNPALNEPFGLTLLEASAAGLPLVATDSGGPNDIVEMCGNGVLVDPRSPHAIAEAALAILSDAKLYARYASAGARVAAAYDWTRHAERYHALLHSLRAAAPVSEAPSQLLICDIDNTLVGCAGAGEIFSEWRRDQAELAFGVATGRSFHSALAILEQQDMPRPQVIISSVGSEIHHLDANGTTYSQDRSWRNAISRGWDREATQRVLSRIPGLVAQAPLEQRGHKLSYFATAPGIVARVRTAMERAGLKCSVIHSHGRYLDVLPIRASKGTAVDFVRTGYRLPESAVIVAGDSGNDVEMLRTVPQAIIVGNYSDGLASLPALAHSYVARGTHAMGVIEGVAHFREKARLS